MAEDAQTDTATTTLVLPTTIPVPDEFNALVLQARDKAAALVVSTPDQYTAAGEVAQTIRGTIRRVQDFFAPMKKAASALHKSIVAAEARIVDPLEAYRAGVDRKLLDFRKEEERKRMAAEEKLRQEAEAKAAAERERLQKQAAAAAKKGDEEKAALLQQQAATVMPVAVNVASNVPTVAGISTRKRWQVISVDLAKLVKAAARNPQLLGYLTADTSALAKSKNANERLEVEGVSFTQTESVTGRSR